MGACRFQPLHFQVHFHPVQHIVPDVHISGVKALHMGGVVIGVRLHQRDFLPVGELGQNIFPKQRYHRRIPLNHRYPGNLRLLADHKGVIAKPQAKHRHIAPGGGNIPQHCVALAGGYGHPFPAVLLHHGRVKGFQKIAQLGHLPPVWQQQQVIRRKGLAGFNAPVAHAPAVFLHIGQANGLVVWVRPALRRVQFMNAGPEVVPLHALVLAFRLLIQAAGGGAQQAVRVPGRQTAILCQTLHIVQGNKAGAQV